MSGDFPHWPVEAQQPEQEACWQQKQDPQEGKRGDIEPPPRLVFPENRVYVPFERRARPEDLILLCATAPGIGGAYKHLANYSFDSHHWQFFTLFYPFMRVRVTGKGVLEVLYTIIDRKCAIIREWHRDLYDPPTRGIPVIESITITPMGDEPIANYPPTR